jgi:conjugative relaxase-like TrwC/TraI family protein
MTMSLHKLSAGDGYLYLVRQVAAADGTERGRASLADYYSAKGESPGRWMGRGLAALADTGARDVDTGVRQRVWTVEQNSAVREEQMLALFGEGLHPNADRISAYLGARLSAQPAIAATQLGRKFHIREQTSEFTRRVGQAYRAHNADRGASGNATIAPDVRAQIRTRIATDVFGERYGRPPADDRELSGFIARNTRAGTTAVAGYDLTFSPVKSVSALWAIAPRPVAERIETAHHAAVADVLDWLQDAAAFTRTGTNGVAQVDTEGLIAAAFTHRDSRAGDPDLHTHLAISNKVSHVDANGVRRWLALDGQPLHHATVAASELYNTRLEAHLIADLGVAFADTVTDTGQARRPVREIIGVNPELLARWSSRRAAIEVRTAELAKQFQHDHRREPTTVELIALAQQATLESRDAKHEPRSLAEQRHTWRSQAIEVLGDAGLHRMLADTLTTRRSRDVADVDEEWVVARAGELIATVSATRSTWQPHHVRAEALRQVRAHGRAHDGALVDRLTNCALGEAFSVPHARLTDADLGEPHALRRRDGSSVYTRHGSQLYTSAETLAAEQRIIAAATRHGGRTVTDVDVEVALTDSAARGKPLNPGQVALVRQMATSGRRLALALAPAGSGKTTAMAALAHAWRSSGGHVVGLAPTAAAAIVLGEDLAARTDTLDKYACSADPATADLYGVPDWFDQIGPDTLLIVDEAGKAATRALDAVIGDALAKGASVRLIGDDGQLASISAGGVLRDLAHHGDTLTLSEVVRFRSPAEAAASLALRAGDPAAIGFYIDQHRIHVGAVDTAADMAFQAWLSDRGAGRDSLLLAPTNAVVDELNTRARAARLTAAAAADPRWRPGRETVLADGLPASTGDLIRTRRNTRALSLGRNDFVRNGYTFEVLDVTADGALRVRHRGTHRQITLPPDYVAEHVTLGYAATIDSAQGLTAGHGCHVVGADHLTRQHLYVALTRGRGENHLYLSTAEADPHRLLSPKATHPDTAVDVLTRILARDGAQVSATTAARHAADPAARLAAAADMYYDALGAAAEHHLGEHARTHLDTLAESVHTDLSTSAAWPVLRRHLALLAISGADPRDILTTAAARGALTDAADPAAVLDHRIDPTGAHSAGVGVLRWLPAIPVALADDPQWGAYLGHREQLVEHLADQIRDQARSWTRESAPPWAQPLLAVNTALTAEIAVFRAATGVTDADTRLTGAPQHPAATRAVQDLLHHHAAIGLQRDCPDTTQYNDLLDAIDPRIRADAHWPQLAAHLADPTHRPDHLRDAITTAAHQGPLPDDLTAAALWWRITDALPPSTPAADPILALRAQYDTVCGELATLDAQISAGTGPALRAAADQLLDMRRRVDANRPHDQRVTDVIARWSDADAHYTDVLRMIEHARTQLDLLRTTPEADELDIASARTDLAFHTARLPAQPPSQRFLGPLADAQAARIAAAGGPAQLVTERDIAALRRTAEQADLQHRKALRRQRDTLRQDITRAERGTAADFAATRIAATDDAQRIRVSDQALVDLLAAAARHADPLPLPAQQDPARTALAAPYVVATLPAQHYHRELAEQIAAAAAAAARPCLNAHVTPAQPAAGGPSITLAALADQIATHQPPRGTVVVVDDAANADPAHLATVAAALVPAHGRLLLITTDQPGPARRTLDGLTLPWVENDRPPTQLADPRLEHAATTHRERANRAWRTLTNPPRDHSRDRSRHHGRGHDGIDFD